MARSPRIPARSSAPSPLPRWLRIPPSAPAPSLREEEALLRRAVEQHQAGKLQEARALYAQILARRPDQDDVQVYLAILNAQQGDIALAISQLQAVVLRNPRHEPAHCNLGNALREAGRHDEALRHLDAALALRPDSRDALYNRATVLRELDRKEQALAAFQQVHALQPSYAKVLNNLLDIKGQLCDWPEMAELEARAVQSMRTGQLTGPVFVNLLNSQATARDQWIAARQHALQTYPAMPAVWTGQRHAHEKIRVAYLSADFHDHATSVLMADLFEQHSRDRFEWTALSFGPQSASAMRRRLVAAFDRFEDVRSLSDRDVAQWMFDQEIDIAVDLKGFTGQHRFGIFTHRGAPIQVNYLGYPGTLGSDCIDYILGDAWVTPPDHQEAYSERIVRLPGSYQPNDRQRPLPAAAQSELGESQRQEMRASAGLPRDGFVFCCFNSHHKIQPQVFDIWMRLLHAVPGSVLWLLSESTEPGTQSRAQSNLKAQAGSRGIPPERLCFAPRSALATHLERMSLADLFLDTSPYNAHTTASDALWVGLPVLTCPGQTFASRVGASVVAAAGVPELIAPDWHRYEQSALTLARQPEMLRSLRQRLRTHRATCSLFDTPRLARALEAAFDAMYRHHRSGQASRSLDVSAT